MSFSLHTEALAFLRYGKRLPVVCTEAGSWNADVLGMNASMCIEVEIKKSMGDLRAEFRNKPHKHFVYNNAGEFDPRKASGYVPNYFYFFVPPELGQKAEEFLREKAPKAGLMVAYPARRAYGVGKRVEVRVRPKKLHDRPPSPSFLRTAVMRMSSQICGFRIAMDELKLGPLGDELVRTLERYTAQVAGTLDIEDFASDLEARAAEMAWCVDQKLWKDMDQTERLRWLVAAHRFLSLQRQTSEVKDAEIV